LSHFSSQLDLNLDPRLKNFLALQSQIQETDTLLHAIEWKRHLAPEFPILISILGGTGAGKSVLFNSLIAARVSKVGVRRPCTKGAVICCPTSFIHILKDFCEEWDLGSESEIFPCDLDNFQNVILVDTPDFDSVERSNQIISDHFFILSDVILFVASQEKYADLLGRNVIRHAFTWKKEVRVVLNKAVSESAFEDFQQSLRDEFQEIELNRIDRVLGTPDILPLDGQVQPICNLFQRFQSIEEVKKLRCEEYSRLRSKALESVETTIESIQGLQARVQRVIRDINSALERVIEGIELRLDVSGSKDIEEKIQARLENLLRKYDILYAPRTALRGAFRKIFSTIRGIVPFKWPIGNETSENESISIDRFMQIDCGYSLPHIEASIARFNLKVAEVLSSDEDFSDFRRIALESCERFTSEQIRTFYEESFPKIEELLELEFEKFKEGLSTTDEIKLYGSYTLWAVFLVTAEVAIGGGLTLLDMVLNTAIVPFIPKWLLKLKIVDILRDIAERVDSQRRDALREILGNQARVYNVAFSSLVPDDESVDALLQLRGRLQQSG